MQQLICLCLRLFSPNNNHLMVNLFQSGYTQGRIQGGTAGARPPKIGRKKKIFLRKIVIFHTKYPKYFRASLRSAQFFKVRPLTWNPGSAPEYINIICYLIQEFIVVIEMYALFYWHTTTEHKFRDTVPWNETFMHI